MKKVLIITYYWPPAGGAGVQRWLKFVKYFREFNIEPIVYTVKNGAYPITDDSLFSDIPQNLEILKKPIFEPQLLLSKFKKLNNESTGLLNPKPSFFNKIIQYIRANYFIPDSRKYWVKPSVKFLKKYIENNKIDIVITTGPPHSLHLIGWHLKNELNIKWISDFRDPWTEIDYFYQLPLSKKAMQKHKELEKQILTFSDAVLVVGKTMQEKFEAFNNRVYVVTNGFDIEPVNNKITLDLKFSITHIGSMNADRNPKILWEVLSEIVTENTDFANDLALKLIGKTDNSVIQSLGNNNLLEFVEKYTYLPHNKIISLQRKSQVLLLAVNNVPSAKQILTGKVFEYLNANRPILAIAPEDGDLANLISTTKSGFVVDFNNKSKLKDLILELYQKFKSTDGLTIQSENINQFHRKNLTKKVSEIIHSISK